MLGACWTIEAAQYFGLYAFTFDPRDLLAYAALVVPTWVVDRATMPAEPR